MIAAFVGALLARDTYPVLLRAPFGVNQLTGEDHNYVLFNPLRNRSPERTAFAYLIAMKEGDCTNAQKLGMNVVLPNHLTCEQIQTECRNSRNLFVQRLRDRRESGGEVLLYYSNSGYEGNWVAVRQTGSDWQVVNFNKIQVRVGLG